MTGAPGPVRTVPLPVTISDAARAALERFGANAVLGDHAYPDPKDGEAWRAFVSLVNESILTHSPLYGVAERSGITSETQTLNGVTAYVARPQSMPPALHDKVYLEIHGGGLVFLAGEGTRRGNLREAQRSGVTTVSVDYRVPPDHPYPAALDDCLSVYQALLVTHQASDIIIGGVSGGGNLAAALALRARDEGLPQPAGLMLFTPEIDLTESGDTFETLAGIDPILTHRLTIQIAAYAAGADLRHPYLSPLFGDFTGGYPRTFLQSGTRDMFLSNTVRMHRALRDAGIEAELHVWEAMPHGGFGPSPEDESMDAEMRRFMNRCWAANRT